MLTHCVFKCVNVFKKVCPERGKMGSFMPSFKMWTTFEWRNYQLTDSGDVNSIQADDINFVLDLCHREVMGTIVRMLLTGRFISASWRETSVKMSGPIRCLGMSRAGTLASVCVSVCPEDVLDREGGDARWGAVNMGVPGPRGVVLLHRRALHQYSCRHQGCTVHRRQISVHLTAATGPKPLYIHLIITPNYKPTIHFSRLWYLFRRSLVDDVLV